MVLIRADEMHFARQRRLVTGSAQVVCISRDRRGHLGRIVVGANGRT